jgi:hypothetical protein
MEVFSFPSDKDAFFADFFEAVKDADVDSRALGAWHDMMVAVGASAWAQVHIDHMLVYSRMKCEGPAESLAAVKAAVKAYLTKVPATLCPFFAMILRYAQAKRVAPVTPVLATVVVCVWCFEKVLEFTNNWHVHPGSDLETAAVVLEAAANCGEFLEGAARPSKEPLWRGGCGAVVCGSSHARHERVGVGCRNVCARPFERRPRMGEAWCRGLVARNASGNRLGILRMAGV